MYRLQDFWRPLLGTVGVKPEGRRFNRALNPINFSIHYFPYLPDEPYRPF